VLGLGFGVGVGVGVGVREGSGSGFGLESRLGMENSNFRGFELGFRMEGHQELSCSGLVLGLELGWLVRVQNETDSQQELSCSDLGRHCTFIYNLQLGLRVGLIRFRVNVRVKIQGNG
jgi:hypothetical protein